MRFSTWMWLVILCPALAVAAPVYRCSGADGGVTFSDKSCPGRGEELSGSAIEPSVIDSGPSRRTRSGRVTASRARRSARTVCDNAADLRHLDLMIDSAATDDRQRRFLKTERRRVESCKLDRLDAHERRLRDAALNRTGSLRDADRIDAQREIEDIYARHGVGFQSQYRRHAGDGSGPDSRSSRKR